MPPAARAATGVVTGLVLAFGLASVYQRTQQDEVSLPAEEQALVDLLDDVRATSSCPQLRVDAALTAMADDHARDMVTRGFLSTVNPSGEDATMRARRFRYPGSATDHYAAGLATPSEVVTEWANPAIAASAAVSRQIRTCSLVSVGVGHDAGTAVPALAAHVWVIALGDR
jgi:uncharacterized protein YkwD